MYIVPLNGCWGAPYKCLNTIHSSLKVLVEMYHNLQWIWFYSSSYNCGWRILWFSWRSKMLLLRLTHLTTVSGLLHFWWFKWELQKVILDCLISMYAELTCLVFLDFISGAVSFFWQCYISKQCQLHLVLVFLQFVSWWWQAQNVLWNCKLHSFIGFLRCNAFIRCLKCLNIQMQLTYTCLHSFSLHLIPYAAALIFKQTPGMASIIGNSW